MPQFVFKDGRHFVAYITGPSHVLLGINFSRKFAEPALVKLPAQGTCSHGTLDEARIHEAVQEVLAAHRADGEEIFASEIAYVENDSPRYDLYRIAAHVLTKHFLSNGEFTNVA
jgi:hypothetical protein